MLESTIEKAKKWMASEGLRLAAQKTELIIISNKRRHNDIPTKIGDNNVMGTEDLGIQIDGKRCFTEHARRSAGFTYIAVHKLARVMPNISMATQRRITLYSIVIHSTLLYGAPIYADKMSRTGLDTLCRVQRRIALRVASAYRTVSADAILVIASIPPLELQALSRREQYLTRDDPEQALIRDRSRTTTSQPNQKRRYRSNKGR